MDEQVIEWDGNFKRDLLEDEAELMLACSEREVYIDEYRRVLAQAIAYRAGVRSSINAG